MIAILFATSCILFPVVLLYLCHRYTWIDRIGAGLFSFAVGILIGNIGILPDEVKAVQKIIMSVTVPLAIPLMIFPTDLKRWIRLAGKSLLSFVFVVCSVMTASFTAYMIYRGSVEEVWKIAGMLVGGFTGATPNFFAVAMALKVKEHMLVLATTASWLVEVPWFLFILAYGQRFLGIFLPPFKLQGAADGEEVDAALQEIESEKSSFINYQGIFTRAKFLPLMKALGLAVVIFAIGGGLFSIAPKEHNMAVLMLTITTLGIGCSFIPSIRNIEMSFQLGQYIILVFCVAVGSTADFSKLIEASPAIIGFASVVLFGSWILHIVLSALTRIDTDTQIITSVAGIFSPVFVPIVAAALKNREIIISGLAAGIIGYAVGNYLGIAFSYFLRLYF